MFDETSTDATAEIDTEKVATALAQTERPAIITYWEGSVARMYVFAVGDDGALYVRWWDGTTWRWASQGKPPGVNYLNKHVSAITYTDNGTRMIYVFTLAADRLYVNYWDGHSWRWADQGRPSDIASHNHLTASVSAITYREGDHRRIYVFVPSLYGALFVNWWDGKQWLWANLGAPPNGASPGALRAITYRENGIQRIYAFASDGPAALAKGRLYVCYWDGQRWQWSDQGRPAPNREVLGPPDVVTYEENGVRRIYAFTGAGFVIPETALFVNWWNGWQWLWADQNGGGTGESSLHASAVTYIDAQGKRRIYVFMLRAGRFMVNWWDGTQWRWDDHGKPPTSVYLGTPVSAHAHHDGATQRIHVFFTSIDGHLWARYWDGANWHWSDQGTP